MDVGATLHAARIERSLFIPELVYKTRIRADIIQAIENNDYSLCGGDVFARGHVRTLALALGLDPEPLLEAMGVEVPPTVLEQEQADTVNIWELQERAERPAKRRTWAMIASAATVVVAAVVWYSQSSTTDTAIPGVTTSPSASQSTATPSATPTETASPTPTATPTETASPTPTATPTKKPTPKPTKATPATPAAVKVEVRCIATSWVRISNSTGVIYEDIMEPGDSKFLSSTSDVTVRAGNAGGIKVGVNGKRPSTLGSVDAAGSRTFRIGG